MARSAHRGRVFESGDLDFAIAGTSISLFNAAFAKAPARSRDEVASWASRTVDEFRKANVPGVLTAPASWLPPGSEEVLQQNGLVRAFSFMGMRTARLNDPEFAAKQIDLREFTPEDAVEPLARINGEAYGMDAALWRQLLLPDFWRSPVRAYGVFENWEPVAVGAASTANAISYVMWMATLPHARNRGYAEAIMRRAWKDARERDGAKFTALHATPAGRPLYAKLGYLAVAEFPAFGWNP